LKGMAPEVGLEPTTLRLTVAGKPFTADCCDCILSAYDAGLRGF
jgi:hypothetical protein